MKSKDIENAISLLLALDNSDVRVRKLQELRKAKSEADQACRDMESMKVANDVSQAALQAVIQDNARHEKELETREAQLADAQEKHQAAVQSAFATHKDRERELEARENGIKTLEAQVNKEHQLQQKALDKRDEGLSDWAAALDVRAEALAKAERRVKELSDEHQVRMQKLRELTA